MLNKKLLLAMFAVVVLTGSGALYAQGQEAGKNVLATVDGKDITENDVYKAMLQLYPRQADDTINTMANDMLIQKEAANRKLSVTPAEFEEKKKSLGFTSDLSDFLQNVVKSGILAEKMIIEDKKISVSPSDISDYFNANKAKLAEPEQVHLRQIFLVDPKEADDVLTALKAGADFTKMAMAKSKDTADIVANGGDIGAFARGGLFPEIENVAFNMNAGQFSNVIKTDNGFHIIKLEEKKAAKEAKLDADMKAKLKKALLADKIQKELPQWLGGLRAKADIKQPNAQPPAAPAGAVEHK